MRHLTADDTALSEDSRVPFLVSIRFLFAAGHCPFSFDIVAVSCLVASAVAASATPLRC